MNSYCYESVLDKLRFSLQEAEEKHDGFFRLNYVAHAKVNYLRFAIAGIDKVFDFYVLRDTLTVLQIPPVLDTVYSKFNARLTDVAVSRTAVKLETKIKVFQMLCRSPFFNALLKGFEADFDAVSRLLKNQTALEDAYTSKRFTMKQKLSSVLARRKEELSTALAKKLTENTYHLMSYPFAKDCSMLLVEFMSNLKFRPKKMNSYWSVSIIMTWSFVFAAALFVPHPAVIGAGIVASIMVALGVSYFGTRNLQLYETISKSKTIGNVNKFTDINFDLSRSAVLICGDVFIALLIFTVL